MEEECPRRRNPARGTNPPPQVDPEVFQAAVAAAVATALADIIASNNNGQDLRTSGAGDGSNRTRLCTYKDFMNAKPTTFRGDGGVITLTRWFEKT